MPLALESFILLEVLLRHCYALFGVFKVNISTFATKQL